MGLPGGWLVVLQGTLLGVGFPGKPSGKPFYLLVRFLLLFFCGRGAGGGGVRAVGRCAKHRARVGSKCTQTTNMLWAKTNSRQGGFTNQYSNRASSMGAINVDCVCVCDKCEPFPGTNSKSTTPPTHVLEALIGGFTACALATHDNKCGNIHICIYIYTHNTHIYIYIHALYI